MSALPLRTWGAPSALPLVLLHGFLGEGADWEAVARSLQARFHLVAPDLPGHGGATGRPPRDYTMDGAVEAVIASLKEMGAERFMLAGYSMGGRLALHLALRHPDAVSRLALISASPGLETERERAARRALDAERARAFRTDPSAFAEAWTRMPLFQPMDEATRRARADAIPSRDPDEVEKSLKGMGTGAQPSLWEPLRTFGVGTLALAGALDAKYAALARRMAEAPSVTARLVPGAGHALVTTHPQAVAGALADSLA